MPKVISLSKERYMSMIRTLKLPYRGIETSSVVGPFFWCAYDQDDDDPHLRMWNIYIYIYIHAPPFKNHSKKVFFSKF